MEEEVDPWVAQLFPEESEEFINSITTKISGCSQKVLNGAYSSEAVQCYGLSPEEVNKLESKGILAKDPPRKAFRSVQEVADYYNLPYCIAIHAAREPVPDHPGSFYLLDPYYVERLAAKYNGVMIYPTCY